MSKSNLNKIPGAQSFPELEKVIFPTRYLLITKGNNMTVEKSWRYHLIQEIKVHGTKRYHLLPNRCNEKNTVSFCESPAKNAKSESSYKEPLVKPK